MEKVKLYLQDSYNELMYKVTWPTWDDLQSSTILVLIGTLVITAIIFFMDFIFGANPENLFFQGLLYYVYQIFA